jgi:hypothetical protein
MLIHLLVKAPRLLVKNTLAERNLAKSHFFIPLLDTNFWLARVLDIGKLFQLCVLTHSSLLGLLVSHEENVVF